MRLTSLARKIGTTPTKLLETLNSHNIDASNGIHTMLAKDVVQKVLELHGMSEPETIASEPVAEPERVEESDPDKESVEETQDQKSDETDPADIQAEENLPEDKDDNNDSSQEDDEGPAKEGTVDDLETDPMSDIDLIKVKKVKLEGIKVVGKIELPSIPKKTQKAKEKEDDEESDPGNKRSNQRSRSKTGKKRRPPRKTLTYEEKLLKAENEKKRAQKLKAKKEKDKKRKYYESQIKSTNPSKTTKKKKKISKSPVEKQEIVVHKNPIARLWAWLNGKYDRY